MHRALVVLLRLHGRGLMRQFIQDLRRPSGAMLVAWAIVGVATWLGPRLLDAASPDQAGPEGLRAIISLSLLGICIARVAGCCSSRGVCFSLSEIDFLFTSPFTRRELLTYKLAKGMAVAALAALVLAAACRDHAVWPVAAFLGFLLAIIFVQLVSLAVALFANALAEGAITRLQKLLLFAALLLMAIGIGQFLFADNMGNTVQLTRNMRNSWLGFCLLTLFDMFAQTVTSERPSELMLWGTLALTIDVVLLLTVTRLPVHYLEATLSATSAGHPGRMTATSRPPNGRPSVPPLPWLGGAGPIAWRQFTNLSRNIGDVLWLVLIMAASAGSVLAIAAITGNHSGLRSGSAIWLIVFIPALFPFDFRSDIEYMDCLKALPLRSWAVAIGQLATPVVVSSVVQLVVASALVLATQSSPMVLLIGAAFALPLNVLLFSIENILILLMPATIMGQAASGFDYLGRQMVLLLIKLMLLAPCYATALMFGGLAYGLAHESLVAFWLTCWLAFVAIATACVYCVSWAYLRFNCMP